MKRPIKHISAAFLAAFFFFHLQVFAERIQITTASSMLDQTINDFLEDSEYGLFWIAGEKGISRIVRLNSNPKALNRTTTVAVTSLKKLSKDYLIIGTNGKGMFRFHKHNFKMSPVLESELGATSIQCFSNSNDNSFYVGCSNGVYKVDLDNNSAKKLVEGINGKVVYFNQIKYFAIEVDGQPKYFDVKYWKEYSSLNIELKENIYSIEKGVLFINNISYGEEDGVKIPVIRDLLLINNKVCLVGKDSYQFFDDMQGVFSNPVKWKNNIDFISLNNDLYFASKGELEINGALPSNNLSDAELSLGEAIFKLNGEAQTQKEVDLTYNDYNYSFELNPGNFSNIIAYYYKINDGDWIKTNENFDLEGLAHGDFEISVKAQNKYGYSKTSKLVEIHVDHPLKKDWIKYLSYIIAVVLFTLLVIFLSGRRYRAKIDILENAVLDKQREINKLKGKE